MISETLLHENSTHPLLQNCTAWTSMRRACIRAFRHPQPMPTQAQRLRKPACGSRRCCKGYSIPQPAYCNGIVHRATESYVPRLEPCVQHRPVRPRRSASLIAPHKLPFDQVPFSAVMLLPTTHALPSCSPVTPYAKLNLHWPHYPAYSTSIADVASWHPVRDPQGLKGAGVCGSRYAMRHFSASPCHP